MTDNDSADEKIIAIPIKDPSYNEYHDISELPKHIFEEIAHFFEVYKNLEGTKTSVTEVQGREEAMEIITHCINVYEDIFGGKVWSDWFLHEVVNQKIFSLFIKCSWICDII